MCFVNSNSIDDYLVKETQIDPTFFEEKVEEIIKDFFENILIRKVIENEVNVKNWFFLYARFCFLVPDYIAAAVASSMASDTFVFSVALPVSDMTPPVP